MQVLQDPHDPAGNRRCPRPAQVRPTVFVGASLVAAALAPPPWMTS